MDVFRAKQIIESPEEIEVLYEGVPVWIQSVDREAETARVYTADEPDREREVPVRLLEEKEDPL